MIKEKVDYTIKKDTYEHVQEFYIVMDRGPSDLPCDLLSLFILVEGTIERVRVSGVDFSNTSDLLFQYNEGINDTNLWPRE